MIPANSLTIGEYSKDEEFESEDLTVRLSKNFSTKDDREILFSAEYFFAREIESVFNLSVNFESIIRIK